MKEWDYYTVMEKKIRYYADKYDPYGKLDVKEHLAVQEILPEVAVVPKAKARSKIYSKVSQVISIFI